MTCHIGILQKEESPFKPETRLLCLIPRLTSNTATRFAPKFCYLEESDVKNQPVREFAALTELRVTLIEIVYVAPD